MPSTEASRSAWNSPWRGSSRPLDRRLAPGQRHQNAAARIAISAIAIASSSIRSAPATRSLRSPHCQMHSPAAVASVDQRERRDEHPLAVLANTPAEQHDARSRR